MKKLENKIALYVGILILALCIGLGMVSLGISTGIMKKQSEEILSYLTDSAAREIELTLESKLDSLMEIASNETTRTMNWKEQEKYYKEVIDRTKSFGHRNCLSKWRSKTIFRRRKK